MAEEFPNKPLESAISNTPELRARANAAYRRFLWLFAHTEQ